MQFSGSSVHSAQFLIKDTTYTQLEPDKEIEQFTGYKQGTIKDYCSLKLITLLTLPSQVLPQGNSLNFPSDKLRITRGSWFSDLVDVISAL